MSDSYSLVTPENVELSYDVAGLGSRFMAALVDVLIQSVLFFVIGLAVLAGGGLALALLSARTPVGETLVAIMIGGGLLLLFVVLWGYYVFFELAWNGQSPGKRLAGIRVIRQDGYPVGFLESVVRNLVRIIDFLPSYYVIGTTVMLLNGRARRLGDYAAGTLVVKEHRFALPTIAEPRSDESPAGRMPLPSVARTDQAIARDFLQRRATLDGGRRRALARDLASRIAERMRYEIEDGADEAFLERVASEQVRR